MQTEVTLVTRDVARSTYCLNVKQTVGWTILTLNKHLQFKCLNNIKGIQKSLINVGTQS